MRRCGSKGALQVMRVEAARLLDLVSRQAAPATEPSTTFSHVSRSNRCGRQVCVHRCGREGAAVAALAAPC